MDKCENYEKNLAACTCASETCPRKGKCCECVAHHKKNGGLPACLR